MLKTFFTTIKAFIAGFLSTLIFHQGAFALFYYYGLSDSGPYDMTPVWPLAVPSVVSLAFWGGLWGIVIWGLIRNAEAAGYYVGAIILGAIGPTALSLFVIRPLEGLPFAADWNTQVIAGGLVLNGAWGLGVALLMRVMKPPV